MKILVDETVPRMTVGALRSLGHDVKDVRGTAEMGFPDEELWKAAQREGRMLVTTDKGFADRRGEPHNGILIVRLRQPNREKIHDRVMQAMRIFGEREWARRIVVMRDRVFSTSLGQQDRGWRLRRRERRMEQLVTRGAIRQDLNRGDTQSVSPVGAGGRPRGEVPD